MMLTDFVEKLPAFVPVTLTFRRINARIEENEFFFEGRRLKVKEVICEYELDLEGMSEATNKISGEVRFQEEIAADIKPDSDLSFVAEIIRDAVRRDVLEFVGNGSVK
jgi:hypothetical protein